MEDGIRQIWALCSHAAAPGGLLLGLFLAGATGSVMHCVPMCGGFVLGQAARNLQRVPMARLCEWQRLRTGLLMPYHLGRLTTYAALGALAATGTTILMQIPALSALPPLLLIAAAGLFLTQAGGRLASPHRPSNPGRLSAVIAALTRHLDRTRPADGFVLGLALGLLPCGFLYGALAAAAASATPAAGAACMLAFGLGTAPALMILGVAGHSAADRWRAVAARVATPILAVNAALLLLIAARQSYALIAAF